MLRKKQTKSKHNSKPKLNLCSVKRVGSKIYPQFKIGQNYRIMGSSDIGLLKSQTLRKITGLAPFLLSHQFIEIEVKPEDNEGESCLFSFGIKFDDVKSGAFMGAIKGFTGSNTSPAEITSPDMVVSWCKYLDTKGEKCIKNPIPQKTGKLNDSQIKILKLIQRKCKPVKYKKKSICKLPLEPINNSSIDNNSSQFIPKMKGIKFAWIPLLCGKDTINCQVFAKLFHTKPSFLYEKLRESTMKIKKNQFENMTEIAFISNSNLNSNSSSKYFTPRSSLNTEYISAKSN